MHIISEPHGQARISTNPRGFRRVRSLADRTKSNVETFLSIVAPHVSEYVGTWGKGSTPTLYVEQFDEQGSRKWDVLRSVDATLALSAHVEAGRTQTPTACGQTSVRAVALRHAPTAFVAYFSIDLDGGYPARDVLKNLVEIFGNSSLLVHSGSGTEGRHRVLGRLDKPVRTDELQAKLGAVLARIGFPVKGGHVEISPGNAASRLPFGCGGCRRFDSELSPLGDDFDDAVDAFLDLVPIDLGSVLARQTKNVGIPVSIPATATVRRFDPYMRRDRQRPTPRNIRRELALGVEGRGERHRKTWLFVSDALRSGFSMQRAISRFVDYVNLGKMDRSADISRYGRAWFIRQIPGIVKRIYSSVRPIGMPDPIPLSPRELAIVDDLSSKVVVTRYESPAKAKNFMLATLPQFKGNLAARLPLVRMHSRLWQAAGGTHYARMRSTLGIFVARTGYKSLATVRARKSLGARDSEAYAISWSTSFDFDRVLPSPTYEIASSIANDFVPPTDSDEVVVLVDLPTHHVDSLPSLREAIPTPQLYVHHTGSPLKSHGSDPECIEPKPVSTARSKTRKGPRKGSADVASTLESSKPSKTPEWRLLRDWNAPCKGMELDEWAAATKSIVDEYKREKRDAIADQTRIERMHGIRTSIGKIASERFHELRTILGLVSWR